MKERDQNKHKRGTWKNQQVQERKERKNEIGNWICLEMTP